MIILVALLIFTVIVTIHELGHFWAARRAGILVEEFSIGMGPRILTIKPNETRYSIKLLPLGGSCLMLGEDSDDKIERTERSFNSKSVSWRILVISGGAIMNFLLAFIIASVLAMFAFYSEPTVANFAENSPAQAAGIELGDQIVRINNTNVRVTGDFLLEMNISDGSSVSVVVNRNGELLNFSINPLFYADAWRIGITWGSVVGPFFPETQETPDGNIIVVNNLENVRREGFFGSLGQGFRNMTFSIRATIIGVTRLITGQFAVQDLVGPIGIVDIIGTEIDQNMAISGTATLFTILNFTFLLSANLGVMNLLPLPALDGGRLIFLILEAIRRKPINPEKEGMVHFAGFVLLMILAAFVAYNDISRIFS